MSQPYVGEILLLGFNFAPAGWAFCDGALLEIAQNDTLFNLIGTTFGGDGQTTFGLPNLQGRVPIGMGQSAGNSPRALGEKGGTETATVTIASMPAHNHALNSIVGSTGRTGMPGSSVLVSNPANTRVFIPGAAGGTTLHPSAIGQIGGNQAHENMQPYLTLNYSISLFGVFPSQA